MYAVTGKASDYRDRELDRVESGAVELVLIERCEAENEAGGWEIFWFNDGSNTGAILLDVWGWSGESCGVQPVGMSMDDVFTEKEKESLRELEETRVPAPFGVRYRTVSEEEFDSVEDWNDMALLMSLGRRERWREWQDRLCA